MMVYFFADISETLCDDISPTSLSFYASDPDDNLAEIDYENVDSITDCDPRSISGKVCYGLTFEELSTVLCALTNALKYFKECSHDKSRSRDELDKIKASSIELRNLQAKMQKFMKNFK